MQISHIKNQNDIEILAQEYANYYNNSVLEEKWTTESATKMFKYFYDKTPDLFFVAYDNEKPVGVIMTLLKPWWDGMHLEDGEVFVLPNYRGGGAVSYKHLRAHETKGNVVWRVVV